MNRYNEADQKVLSSIIGAGDYNQARFDARNLANFENGKKKIFLVGDSYAKDFLNLIAESDAVQQRMREADEI